MPMWLEEVGRMMVAYSGTLDLLFGVFAVCALVYGVYRARKQSRRHLAQQQALAASMGFQARGSDPQESAWRNALDAIVDGSERLGPFPRFVGRPHVRILFEGDRDGFQTTVFAHSHPFVGEEYSEPPTTIVCFASPDLKAPAFSLYPAVRMPAAAEAALSLAAMALKPLFGSADPIIELPGHHRFHQLYQIRSSFTGLIEGVFNERVLDFFEQNPGWTVEALYGRVLVCRERIDEPPERMPAFISEATRVAETLRLSSQWPRTGS